MPSKKMFFKGLFEKLDLKRLIIAAIISVVILFPTILAAAFMIKSNQMSQISHDDSLSVVMYDSAGNELYRETETISTFGEDTLVAIFNTMRKDLSLIDEIPQTADKSTLITVHMIDSSKTDVMTMYFSLEENESYCLLNNEAYIIPSDNSEIFFASPYSEVIYKNSSPPALKTADGENIIPTYANWHYKNHIGKFINASKVKLADPLATYHITGEFNVSFETSPDICSIEIFDGEERIFSGALNDTRYLTVDSNTPLRAKIIAQWNYNNRSFYGTVEYDVYVIIHNRAVFSLSSNTVSSLGFTILKGVNIADISKLNFTSKHISPPHFSVFGETAYAIIYCPENFEGNNIEFTVSYGVSLSTFKLSVNQSNDIKSNEIDIGMGQLGLDFSDIPPKFDSPPYLFGRIISPESYGFYNTLKVGDKDGKYYSYRRVYTTPNGMGADIFALSGGMVSYIGNNEELGKYAVVDIGLGLSVIYSNLSNVDVSVGDILAAGQIIGKSGDVPRGGEGFSLTLWYNGNLFDSELLFLNT